MFLFEVAGVESVLEAILVCKVDVVTKGLAPDVAARAEADMPAS
jgi:predicted nucleotidyltransferase